MPRTVLITGCSDGGMGAALAKEFHCRGDRVLATARDPAKMASLITAGIETLLLDVASEDSILACVRQVSSLTGGSLDILVNNAGRSLCMPLTDLSIAEAKQVFDLNFWAILRMSQIFFPLLQQAARMNGCALLVNQTSVSSIGGAPFFSAYNTSKAAAAMLVHDLRLELAPFGIEVIELKTGAVKTNIHENDPVCQLPPGSPYTPIHEEIAKFSKGDDMIMNAQDPMIWAGNVVTDLNKPTPPNIIWRGTYASRVRLASILPVSAFDSTFRRVSKLDVLEQKLEATHANGTQA